MVAEELQDVVNSRTAERKPVRLAAVVRRNSSTRYPVDILDLSVSGFRFLAVASVPVGTRVWLAIPGMAGLEATVTWERGGQFGCAFDRPLNTYVFDHIVRNCS